ncbi:hypothetical protein Cci01nite_51790 [Catellatospora citrea]|uniref:Uncharacterized protein n=2 Tax=Catellatospora citrea TaxID=53366 RepID=A0A8J3P3H3_9ACTN|nr:hypothetical protein C8E86_0211 [Catellatospora citrea]GIG00086.1 hypothetical protein Cci01nite_51790 [Catellatospora citrea]
MHLAAAATGGHRVRSAADLGAWLDSCHRADLSEAFTFVVDIDGILRLAPRRSEHVACAAGAAVLAAGEILFCRDKADWAVDEITNQSTGYCPDLDSWTAVAAALDAAGLPHPAGFTQQYVFRRCPQCGERNIVRENDFVCAVCDADLPTLWNF